MIPVSVQATLYALYAGILRSYDNHAKVVRLFKLSNGTMEYIYAMKRLWMFCSLELCVKVVWSMFLSKCHSYPNRLCND